MFNLIYANVFFEHESNESCKCAALALSRIRCWIISISAAASGHACKSVLNPYINQRTKGQKKSVVKDSVCIRAIRELFFDLRSVAAGSQDELQQGLSMGV